MVRPMPLFDLPVVLLVFVVCVVYAKLKCPKTDGIACPDIAGI